MKQPQKILVVITREKPAQPALERALLFANSSELEITLFSSIYEPALELTAILAPDERKMLRSEYTQSRVNYLNELKQKYESKNIKISTDVVWHKKTAQAIVDYTHDHDFDLTIKRISSDANSKNPFITPTDWQLLRFVSSPLLLVRDEEWKRESAILGAVCPTSECEEHQELNHKIIDYTQYLAEMLGSEAHLVNSHVAPTIDAPMEYPSIDFEELRNKVTLLHSQKMQELIAEHPFSEQHIHVVEGLAEEKIPRTAEKINAQLVVMGTVGRTGLTAAFMGNTAERVLARLRCEVLALKPNNFEI